MVRDRRTTNAHGTFAAIEHLLNQGVAIWGTLRRAADRKSNQSAALTRHIETKGAEILALRLKSTRHLTERSGAADVFLFFFSSPRGLFTTAVL
jgi:hypothetical protein